MSEEYVTDETEGLTAICTMQRRGWPTLVLNRFSLAMAEQAHLLEKEGPSQSYPQRMLKMRARSWTIRDGFADVLRGLHLSEEVEDYAGSLVVTLPRHVSQDRARSSSSAVPRPRRSSKNGSGVEALWALGSADGDAAVPSNVDADATSGVTRSDNEAARPICPQNSVTETAERKNITHGADNPSVDATPKIPEPEAGKRPRVLVDPAGAVGAFSGFEALGGITFDPNIGHRCQHDQPADRQQDATNADVKAATEPQPQTTNLNHASAIARGDGKRPLTQRQIAKML
jgi:hypothetical protein